MEEDPYRSWTMRTYTAVVEQDPGTRFYVGYVPGFAGAHSQGETIDELRELAFAGRDSDPLGPQLKGSVYVSSTYPSSFTRLLLAHARSSPSTGPTSTSMGGVSR
jgi:hypothetical protein